MLIYSQKNVRAFSFVECMDIVTIFQNYVTFLVSRFRNFVDVLYV